MVNGHLSKFNSNNNNEHTQNKQYRVAKFVCAAESKRRRRRKERVLGKFSATVESEYVW